MANNKGTSILGHPVMFMIIRNNKRLGFIYTSLALGCLPRIFFFVTFPSDTDFGPLAEMPPSAIDPPGPGSERTSPLWLAALVRSQNGSLRVLPRRLPKSNVQWDWVEVRAPKWPWPLGEAPLMTRLSNISASHWRTVMCNALV